MPSLSHEELVKSGISGDLSGELAKGTLVRVTILITGMSRLGPGGMGPKVMPGGNNGETLTRSGAIWSSASVWIGLLTPFLDVLGRTSYAPSW